MSKRRLHDVHPAVASLVDQGTAWISRLRLKAFLWVLMIAAAAWATVALTSIAWVPVVGVAAVAAAVSINKIASRLTSPVCMSCGEDLSARPVGAHGIACPACGAIHMPRPGTLAAGQPEFDDEA